MARKKLLILSSDAGYGHRSAAMAVQSAFRRLYGDRADCALINPLDNEKVPKLLRRSQHDYDKIVRKWPDRPGFHPSYLVSSRRRLLSGAHPAGGGAGA